MVTASAPTDWRALDPENTLYVELATGRVIIELAPQFAPEHLGNIRTLARAGYWQGRAAEAAGRGETDGELLIEQKEVVTTLIATSVRSGRVPSWRRRSSAIARSDAALASRVNGL